MSIEVINQGGKKFYQVSWLKNIARAATKTEALALMLAFQALYEKVSA